MLKPEEDDHKMADTDYFSSFRWISRKNSVVGSVATLNKGSSPSLSWAWPSSAQLVCVPSLCNPDSCFWTWLPTLWLSECWHLFGTWLTMTMVQWLPSSLGLTSYPMLVWSVCGLAATMCSQVYPDYKGYRTPMSGSIWREAPQGGTYGGTTHTWLPVGWWPMVLVLLWLLMIG